MYGDVTADWMASSVVHVSAAGRRKRWLNLTAHVTALAGARRPLAGAVRESVGHAPSAAVREAFNKDGFIILPAALGALQIASLRSDIDAAVNTGRRKVTDDHVRCHRPCWRAPHLATQQQRVLCVKCALQN